MTAPLCIAFAAPPAFGVQVVREYTTSVLGGVPVQIAYDDERSFSVATPNRAFRTDAHSPGELQEQPVPFKDGTLRVQLVPHSDEVLYLRDRADGRFDLLLPAPPRWSRKRKQQVEGASWVEAGKDARLLVVGVATEGRGPERVRIIIDGEERDAWEADEVRDVALSHDGRAAAVIENERVLVVGVDARTRRIDGTFRHAEISSRGRILLLNRLDDTKQVRIVGDRLPAREIDAGAPVHGMRVSPDGRHAVIWHRDGRFRFLDPERGVLGAAMRPTLGGYLFVSSAVIDNEGRVTAGLLEKDVPARHYGTAHLLRLERSGVRWCVPSPPTAGFAGLPEVLPLPADRLLVRTSEALWVLSLAGSAGARRWEPMMLAVDFDQCPPPASDDDGWPITPMDRDHVLLATMEYMHYDGEEYIHPGFDIAAVPHFTSIPFIPVNPAASCAMVRRPGAVVGLERMRWNSKENYASIRTTSLPAEVDSYLHLEPHAFHPDVVDAYEECLSTTTCPTVEYGQPIAKIWRWGVCDHHHLHFERLTHDNEQRANPMTNMTPFDDQDPPEVEDVLVCEDEGVQPPSPLPEWSGCQSLPSRGSCLPVWGRREILVKTQGGYPPSVKTGMGVTGWQLGPLWIAYRACPDDRPTCDWQGQHSMEGFVAAESFDLATTLYSNRARAGTSAARSTSDYCVSDDFWMVVSNTTIDGAVSRGAAWDTSSLEDGYATLNVLVEDHDGDVVRRGFPVCVSNHGGCAAKLLIRDCPSDNGGQPSECRADASTPDIGRQMGGADYHLRVCASNVGCGALDPDAAVRLRVRLDNRRYPGGALAVAGSAPLWEREWTDTPSVLIDPWTGSRTGQAWPPGVSRCIDLQIPAGRLTNPAYPQPSTPERRALLFQLSVPSTGDLAADGDLPTDDNNQALFWVP